MNGIWSKISPWEYLLMVFFIFVCGNPVFSNLTVAVSIEVSILLLLLMSGKFSVRPFLVEYLLCYVLIFLLQFFILARVSFLGYGNVIFKILFGATVMWTFKEKFRFAYLDVMTVFAAISLICFAIQMADLPLPLRFFRYGSSHFYTGIIYNYSLEPEVSRNCGIFWEPGAYACYLMVVPLLFMDDWKSLIKINPAKCFILVVALLSTFSTTGYIAFFTCIVLGTVIRLRRRWLMAVLILPILLFLGWFLYTRVDFLEDKILDQSENVDFSSIPEYSSTRMGSFVFDLHYIKKHPLVGNGLLEETRYADNPELWGLSLGHGNGFSNFLAQMGIPLFLLFCVMLYLLLPFNTLLRIAFILVVILLLQGEQLMNYPLFLSLPFVVINQDIVNARRMERFLRWGRYRSIQG